MSSRSNVSRISNGLKVTVRQLREIWENGRRMKITSMTREISYIWFTYFKNFTSRKIKLYLFILIEG